MRKVLVHLHVYYNDQVDYFIEKLGNINGVSWDLVVTYSEWNEQTSKKLRMFKPDVSFVKVDNYGYDIMPFIMLMKETDLQEYDYVIKLHTKRSMGKCRPNIIMFEGYDWRNALVDGILYSRDHFMKVLNKFEQNPCLGMISNLSVCVTRDYYHDAVRKELTRIGLEKKDRHTCMGSMFMMRSEPLQLLKNDLITEDIFKKDIPLSGTFFQKAHLYERILSHLPINAGMRYETVCPNKSDFYRIKISKAIEPVGKFFFWCQREGPMRQKVIRVLGITVYKGE